MRAAPMGAIAAAAQPVPTIVAGESRDAGHSRLWAGSTLAMMTLHAGVLAAAVLWRSVAPEPPPPPPSVMMIELAPPPAPADRIIESAPDVPKVPIRPVAEESKPTPPVKKAEVIQPKPKPKPKLVSQPKKEIPSTEMIKDQTKAPVAIGSSETIPPQERPKNPEPSLALRSNTMAIWQGSLLSYLERRQRYPSVARFRHEEGSAYVRFAVNREGTVLWARLERGSGHDLLDAESLALVERAQPLPPPPPDLKGNLIEIVVPIRFSLK